MFDYLGGVFPKPVQPVQPIHGYNGQGNRYPFSHRMKVEGRCSSVGLTVDCATPRLPFSPAWFRRYPANNRRGEQRETEERVRNRRCVWLYSSRTEFDDMKEFGSLDYSSRSASVAVLRFFTKRCRCLEGRHDDVRKIVHNRRNYILPEKQCGA